MAENRTLKGIYGEAGAVYLAGTGSNLTTGEGDFCAILVLADAVISSLDSTDWPELTDNEGGLDALTISKGTTIYGQFKKVTLASGKALVYKSAK